MQASTRSWRDALLSASGATLVLLVFRALQLRSAIHVTYHGESAGVGKLLWFLHEGTLSFEGPRAFFREMTYFEFAQGTVVLQLVAAGLAPLLGLNLWALHGAGLVMEAAGVFVLCVLAARMSRGYSAAVIAMAALVFVPRTVQAFHLVPYGNHSEFLWVPALLALWLYERGDTKPRWPEILLPIAVGAVGVFCYRLVIPAVLASAIAMATAGGRDRLLQGIALGVGALLAAWVLLCLGLGLSLHAFVPYFDTVAEEASTRPETFLHQLQVAWLRELPVIDLGLGTAWVHRVGLCAAAAVCAAAFFRPATGPVLVARFASVWAIASFVMVAMSSQVKAQYLIPTYYALALCAVVLLVADRSPVRRIVIGVLVAAFAVAGLLEGVPYLDRSTWASNRPFRGLELQWRMGLNRVELDELPYYHRLLDEDRANVHIGAVTHHALDGSSCRDHVGHRSGSGRPDPAADRCTGWDPGQLCIPLERVAAAPAAGPSLAWAEDVGRGAWIRANRSVAQVERGLEGCAEPARSAALLGARDEARRWGIDPEI